MIKSAIKLMTLFFTCTLAFSLAGCSVGQEASKDGQANNEDAFQIVESNKEEISFDDANILEFKMDSRDDESYDEIIATYSVENISVEPIYYFSADFSYKDASGNILCGDGRFNDFGIPADKKAYDENLFAPRWGLCQR